VSRRRKSNLTAVAIVVGAIALWGCTTTQEVDQTQPPYASISDEGRDPATARTPPQSDDDSRGFFSSAFHFILVGLGFHVD
jgi:hypothetical protein